MSLKRLTCLALLCAVSVFCSAGDTFDGDGQKSTASLSVAELEQRGDAFRSQKEYEGARQYYALALKKNGRSAPLWNKAGMAALQLGRYDEAIQAFSRATKQDKKYAEAVNNLGVAFYLKKDYRRAISHYRKALELRDSPAFHTNLGAAYFDNDEIGDALREYAIALAMDPEILERTSSLGISAHVRGPQDRGRYAFMLARLYAKVGDLEHALLNLRRAMEDGYPQIAEVYSNEDFVGLRQDPRFNELMSAAPVAVTP
ncbi:MAG TPA: tetratricopeptide repeat protein [Clostridia bacterium]|nr:tetratricopeptide repeat protein [Clostridia bacterium]